MAENNISISGSYNFKDKELQRAITNIENLAKEGTSGNLEIYSKKITTDEINNLQEGKPYFCGVTNRLIIRSGKKLFAFEGTVL